MNFPRVLLGLTAAAVLASPEAAATTVINFDDAKAPAGFVSQTTLGAQYEALGVTFSGVGGAGGEILNQASNFGIPARSGQNFLAFNQAVTTVAEQLDFASAITAFEIYISGSGQFWATAYDGAGSVVDAVSFNHWPTSAGLSWRALSLGGSGITRVQFGSSDDSWVADDLSFSTSAVPEPATWAMMIAGFGLSGAALRRRRPALAV